MRNTGTDIIKVMTMLLLLTYTACEQSGETNINQPTRYTTTTTPLPSSSPSVSPRPNEPLPSRTPKEYSKRLTAFLNMSAVEVVDTLELERAESQGDVLKKMELTDALNKIRQKRANENLGNLGKSKDSFYYAVEIENSVLRVSRKWYFANTDVYSSENQTHIFEAKINDLNPDSVNNENGSIVIQCNQQSELCITEKYLGAVPKSDLLGKDRMKSQHVSEMTIGLYNLSKDNIGKKSDALNKIELEDASTYIKEMFSQAIRAAQGTKRAK